MNENSLKFSEYVKYAMLISFYGYLPVSVFQLLYGIVRLDMADAFVSVGMLMASVVIGVALGVMGYPVYLFVQKNLGSGKKHYDGSA